LYVHSVGQVIAMLTATVARVAISALPSIRRTVI
jgi:hypothetical protein